MTSIAFFSAKGAPGATTTAMLVASLWPRQVLLADCDPAGGDVGLRLPSPEGRPLDLYQGLLSLLPVARRSLSPEVVLEHAQSTLGGGEVLVGLSGPEQALAGGPVWSTIAAALGELTDRDTILDVGRLDARSPVLPLVTSAQLAVCVVQATLSGVYASRARLRTLLPALVGSDGSGPRVGFLVRAADARQAESAASVIHSEFPNLAYLGHLVTDPVGAGIFDSAPVSRPERTLLVRSGAQLVGNLTAELDRMLHARTRPAASAPNVPAGGYAAPAEPESTPAAATESRVLTRVEARRAAKTRRFSRRTRDAAESGQQ
jgi:hypothetical protein